MNKIYYCMAAMLLGGGLILQAAPPFGHTVVLRSADGKVQTNVPAHFTIEIVDAPLNGNILYSESHSALSNADGLTTLQIGEGDSPLGDYDSLDWSQPLYLTVQAAIGNDAPKDLGTMQVMAVPQALQAKTASGLQATDDAGRTWTLSISDSGALSWTSTGGAPAYDQSKVPSQLFFIGNMLNWKVAEAVPFTKVSPTLFTITRHLVPDEIFKFTQEQAWGKTDWSGASCNIGTPNPMRETGNTPAFKGVEGDYTITVDFYNYTLCISPK